MTQNLKKILFATAVSSLCATSANAAATLNIFEEGGDLRFVYNGGTLNTSALSYLNSGSQRGGAQTFAPYWNGVWRNVGGTSSNFTAFSLNGVAISTSSGWTNTTSTQALVTEQRGTGIMIPYAHSYIYLSGVGSWSSGNVLDAAHRASGSSIADFGLTDGEWVQASWGTGDNAETFLIQVGASFLDPTKATDFEASMIGGFAPSQLASQVAGTTINGAHHRLLMDSALNDQGWHCWATGDFARFTETDTKQTISEIGASSDFGVKNFRFGVGIGYSDLEQDTAFNGGADVSGEFAVAEANYALNGGKLILSSLFYYGDFEADTQRGYLAGGEFSKGETNLRSMAVRIRADWKNLYQANDVKVTPRLSYSYMESRVDGYTETGGAVPVSYEQQDTETHEFRAGLDIDYAYSEKTTIRTILEAVHQSGNDSVIKGVAGGFDFSVNGDEVNDSWMRMGFEVSHQLNHLTDLHASVFGSSEGRDASFSAALGANISF